MIDPKCLLVITDSVKDIAQRLMTRDGIIYQEEFLKRFQEMEKNHAEYIAEMFSVPLLIYDQKAPISLVYNFISHYI